MKNRQKVYAHQPVSIEQLQSLLFQLFDKTGYEVFVEKGGEVYLERNLEYCAEKERRDE